MKLLFVLVLTGLLAGCAGSSPIAPTAASSSPVSSALSSSPESSGSRALFPPIDPDGISCPSDAPQLALGSFGRRLDIEFSEVTGALAYEIEITSYVGATTRLEVPAPANRAEWYGVPGLYRVRVRTINCGGLGNWSDELFQTLDDGPPPPSTPPPTPPTPPPGPPTPPEPTPPTPPGPPTPPVPPTQPTPPAPPTQPPPPPQSPPVPPTKPPKAPKPPKPGCVVRCS